MSEFHRQKIREILSEKKEEKKITKPEPKLKSEEEYFKALERLVKGAEYLSKELTKEQYEKGMRLYEELEKDIFEYQRSQNPV